MLVSLSLFYISISIYTVYQVFLLFSFLCLNLNAYKTIVKARWKVKISRTNIFLVKKSYSKDQILFEVGNIHFSLHCNNNQIKKVIQTVLILLISLLFYMLK